MKKVLVVSMVLLLALALMVSVVGAQSSEQGSIRGAVYQDVNGDGKCVNTGVAGEGPVANVNLEFVNSDGAYTIHLHSGENGTYGLVAAGFGYWRVTAQPSSEWVVTSQNPVYAAIDRDKPLVLDVNFCVAKGLYYPIVPVFPVHPIQPLPAVLPESGAPAGGNMGTAVFALFALGLIGTGLGLEWRRRLK
jgi:hypothetical protein